jgi:hypothetical protein
MLIFKPSVIAGGAVMLALKDGSTDSWPRVLQDMTGYTEDHLLPCAIDMYAASCCLCTFSCVTSHGCRLDHLRTIPTAPNPLDAVNRKYSADSFMGVAHMDLPTLSTPWKKKG